MTDNDITWAVGLLSSAILGSNAVVLIAMDEVLVSTMFALGGLALWTMAAAARTDGLWRRVHRKLGVDV